MAWLILCSACAQAEPAQPLVVTRWVCSVAYLPARATWVRALEVEHDDLRVSAVRIDGTPVYAFSVSEMLILTALDNERISFDTAAMTWRSDFRGQASGEGRCDRVE